MAPKIFNTPILLLAFKRPETTKQVFEQIRKIRPKELFIAIDGPRNKEEEQLINEVKKILIVDWRCKVHRLYRKKNLGLRDGVPNAIDWFFKNVEKGIILEDDCVPSRSFFTFCEELLKKYENNLKIMHIAGSNEFKDISGKESYIFSKLPFIWGWATWRRAWKKYDSRIKDYPSFLASGKFRKAFPNFFAKICFKRDFDLIYSKNFNTWDYQWNFALAVNNGLSIIPQKNLIQNIGMNDGATNMRKMDKNRSIVAKDLDFPLIHPEKTIVNKKFDNLFFRKYFFRKLKNLSNRTLKKILKR